MRGSKSVHLLIVLAVVIGVQSARSQTANEWLKLLDQNMVMRSAQYTADMTVHLPSGQERFFSMDCKVVGDEFALIEYSEPKRDAGTRYLKRDEDLWIYFPRVDRTMLIQGHMLRQGVQGGDMSFEDMTESSSWEEIYDAEILSEDEQSVTIKMIAHDLTVSYPHLELVINKKTALPMLQVYFDASNEPIKEMEILKFEVLDGRNFPTESIIRSRLVEDKWTKFVIRSMELDVQFDERQFTKQALEE